MKSKKSKPKFDLYRKVYNAAPGDFPYSENMYIDPEGAGDALESIPGYRRLHAFCGRINGIFGIGEWIFVHAGEGLYRFRADERDAIAVRDPVFTLADRKSRAFTLGDRILLSDGERLILIDGSGDVKTVCSDERICTCTVGAFCFGRMYLSGNPKLPGVIFRSDDTDNFGFTEYDVGIDCSRVSSLISSGRELLIFTDRGVYSHTADRGEGATGLFTGVSVVGDAICYLNEPVFLTDQGLMSARGEILSERVSSLLLPRLGEARLTLWQGYIALLCADLILLCKISKGASVRWYCIKDVGSYKKDYPLYRYSPTAEDGFTVHSHTDGAAEGTVMSLTDSDARLIYYTEEGGARYSVYPTEERVGGEFFPACAYLSSGNLLYFGTEGGDLCIFNNDMRGVAPGRIATAKDYDAEEYRATMGDMIHPDFYSHLGHRVSYLIMTDSDNLGTAAERKQTLPGRLTVKYKSYPRSAFDLEVISDLGLSRESFHIGGSGGDFSDLDFSDFCPAKAECQTLTLPERNGSFTEKQICIRGEKFASPIGIISLEYGYKIRR